MRRILACILLAVRAALTGVGIVLDRIAGVFGRGGSHAQMPSAAMSPEDARGEVVGAYEREAAAHQARASDLGLAVHSYASAVDPDVRCAVDLATLNQAQTDWLLGLRDEDLKRLAQAGPKACEAAVNGKRSGVVGLALPKSDDAAQEIDRPHPVKNLLDNRIRLSRARDAELAA